MLGSHRELFEVPREVAYLNNGSYTPLPRAVRAAGEAGVARKSAPWAMEGVEEEAWAVREAAGRLVGAGAEEIAIINAAAYGVATAAANLEVGRGTRILLMEGEFPSLALVWAGLAARRGAVLDVVARPSDGDWTGALLARIEAPGEAPVGVAALTPLAWTDGTMVELERLAGPLKAQGAAIVVDATQAAGVLALDVGRMEADYLVFPTYKWLLGPYTLAFLYVAPGRREGVPLEWHGGNHVGGSQPFAGLPGLRAEAGRFDMGERLNPVSLPMALAGMRLLEGWGRAALEARLRGTTDALAAVAERHGLRAVPRGRRAPHLLGLEVEGAAGLAAALAGEGVFVAERGGRLRLGAHVFNDEEDVARFDRALGRVRG